MTPRKTAVIIGGGVAGATCAAELSTLLSDIRASVLLISPQETIQTPVTLATLTKHTSDISVTQKAAQVWCTANGVKHIKGTVKSLTARTAILEDGTEINFDSACICTGARPTIPPDLSADEFADVVLSVRDADSVRRLRDAVSSARRAIVVGNGGVGMEVVHEVADCDVVWVVRDGFVGGAFFDERAAGFLDVRDALGAGRVVYGSADRGGGIFGGGVGPGWLRSRVGNFGQEVLEADGNVRRERRVRVVEKCEVMGLRRDDSGVWPVIAVLSNGEEVCCDLIVAGTGVVPNVEWLAGSGVELADAEGCVGGGVAVDVEGMHTSVCGIFAAGDCATVKMGDAVGGNWFQMRLWTQAMTAGRAAALGMMGYMSGVEIDSGLDFEVFAHATSFFGKSVVFLGRYAAQGIGEKFEFVESCYEEDGSFIRAVVVNGRVCGALLVGLVDRAETFENLIIDGLDVERLKAELVDRDADLEDYFD